MSVRAKMKCEAVELRADGEGGKVTLRPVISGSPENESFYRWTPSGSLQLGVINPGAISQFELGREYYVDITPAG